MLQRADTLLPKFKVNWKCFWIWCVLIVKALHLQFTVSKEYKINSVFFVKYWIFGNCYFLNYLAITNIFAIKQGRLPFERKIRLEWNARNGTGFSRCGVSPSPRLSRLEENNKKSKWRLHLQRRMAGKEAEVHRVEWEFTNGTGFFRSFRLEREKRNTSEDFHLFQKLSDGMSCTIWVSNRNFRFLLQMVNAPGNTI